MINIKRRGLIKNLLLYSSATYLAACENSINNSKDILSDKFPNINLKMVTSFDRSAAIIALVTKFLAPPHVIVPLIGLPPNIS